MLDTPTAARVVQLSAKQLFMMFPTPMFTGMLPDIGLCDRIEKKLRELQKSGKGYPSPGGKILAYMTPDDIQTLPEMKALVDVIMAEASSILDFYAINRDFALHHQHVGEHRQSEPAPQLSHPSELPIERPRLYQGAEELRRDDIRFPAHSFEKY